LLLYIREYISIQPARDSTFTTISDWTDAYVQDKTSRKCVNLTIPLEVWWSAHI